VSAVGRGVDRRGGGRGWEGASVRGFSCRDGEGEGERGGGGGVGARAAPLKGRGVGACSAGG